MSNAPLLLRVAPPLFVLIWSTGWIVAGFAAEFADPLTFLSARYLLAGACLVVFAAIAGASWPKRRADWVHAMASGVLLHAIYLGGVWWAIRHGLPASISGLLAAIQPILTAVLSPIILREPISARQWAGVGLGLAGLVFVLWPKLAGVSGAALAQALVPLTVNAIAMVSVTFGSFYQKKFVASGDLRTVTVLQYFGALLVTLPVAWLLEDMRIDWSLKAALTMAWSVLALSIGAISLLLMLIRRGAVARAAVLIYLVPPAVAIQAWAFFGESLLPIQVLGMVLAATGVALATRK